VCYGDFNLIRNRFKDKVEKLFKNNFIKEGLFDITRTKYFINNKVECNYLDYLIIAN